MIKKVDITIIVDNKSLIGDEYAPGGFSALIENLFDDGSIIKILFDTGPENERLEVNLKKLGLEISDIDYIVLSHGHFDHTGGLLYAYNNSNEKTKIICHPGIFNEKILKLDDGSENNVGIKELSKINELRNKGRIYESKERHNLNEYIWTTGEISRTNKIEDLNSILKQVVIRENGKEKQDEIDDDISLVIELEENKKIIVCGCCHSGIVNTIDHVKKHGDDNIIAIIGGLQLYQANEELLEFTKKRFQELPLKILYPMHSSGDLGIDYFKEELREIYKEGGVGTKIVVDG